MKVLLVGYGRMGQALSESWLSSDNFDLTVVSPHCPNLPNFFTSAGQISQQYQADIIVFAVKPQILVKVVPEYRKFVHEHTLVISVATGVSLNTLKELINGHLVRAMPNLPVVAGQGVIGLYACSLSGEEQQLVNHLFKDSGTTVWVESEDLIDAITALSGSGPAYFYYFTECLSQAGQGLGLPTELSAVLARQTFVGAAAVLAAKPDQAIAQLRQQVTSPNGTTAAALAAFEQEELERCVDIAVKAALQRARELSQ